MMMEEAVVTEANDDLVDITSLVEGCAACLTFEDSILCDKESFSLHDSMAALEIMSPSMDCCEIPASTVAHSPLPEGVTDYMVPPRPYPTGIDDDISPLPWEDLSMCDATFIALEALTRLESMLSGACAAESIFTCLYAHSAVLNDMKSRLFTSTEQKGTPAQLAVYATILALVTIGKVVRNIVLNADIYEEEDFAIQTHGMDFNEAATEDETVEVIMHGIKCVAEDASGDDARMIGLVLRFELHFLEACMSMVKLDSEKVVKVVEETKENVRSGLEALKELQPIVVAKEQEEEKARLVLRRSFDPFMYRNLVGNTPIRKVVFRKPSESVPVLMSVFAEVEWSACDLLLRGGNLGRVRRMLNRFSASSVNILSRSMMVLNLYFADKFLGQHSLPDLIAASLKQLGGAPDDLLAGKYGQAFLNRLAKPVYDILKLSLLNKNRRRAYMEAVMIPDWASIQQEARAVDLNYCHENDLPPTSPPFFSHFVLYNMVWLMDHYVALGMELNLFHGHHDINIACWYRDVVLSSLINTVTAMRQTKTLHPGQEENQAKGKPKGKKKGSKGAAKKTDGSVMVSPTQEDLEDEFDLMLLVLKRGICRGISRFIPALCQAKVVQEESYEFTTHEQRFNRQFEAFGMIMTPAPLKYDDFRQGSDFSTVSQADLLMATSQSFSSSKATADELLTRFQELDQALLPLKEEELRSLVKVCVGNSIYVMKLLQQIAGGAEAGGKVKVEFDLQTNGEFCTIKIS